MIATDVLDSEEAYEYGSIDDDVAALDEEDESGLLEAGVSTGMTEVGTKEVEGGFKIYGERKEDFTA